MKVNTIIVAAALVLSAYVAQAQEGYQSFGKSISNKNSVLATKNASVYQGLMVKDSVQTKFTAEVKDVCKVKGCWMTVALNNGEQAMVRFKDYGFFMPKDIVGKEVVINGFAFVEEMSVEDQKHYAKDGGASEAEIAKITKPKKTYGFEADGVLVKE